MLDFAFEIEVVNFSWMVLLLAMYLPQLVRDYSSQTGADRYMWYHDIDVITPVTIVGAL